jgi:hypothetical protein
MAVPRHEYCPETVSAEEKRFDDLTRTSVRSYNAKQEPADAIGEAENAPPAATWLPQA